MRESNFAFPTQNKACVCITSQLYDRRALDTSSPLPLLNSLTHLTYLTSTSPRIREIMTMDGGLERLVRILHDFCLYPPPPENGAVLYGLIPPSVRPPKPTPTLNPQAFDKQAAYRFSLAFQCVVNIGVRGSEPIRSRVVQAGTLDVVGCILEAWLANKGFAVGPSASATGIPRETREQRQARRDAHLAMRQREQHATAGELGGTRNRQHAASQRGPRPPTLRLPGQFEEDESMDVSIDNANLHDALLLLSASTSPSTHTMPGSSANSTAVSTPSTVESDTEMSTDVSTAATPVGSGTPTGSVVVPARDRSGTVIARPIWDSSSVHSTPHRSSTATTETRRDRDGSGSPLGYTDDSRPQTETEDDGEGDTEIDADGDVDMDRFNGDSGTIRQGRRGTVVSASSSHAGGSGDGNAESSHLYSHGRNSGSEDRPPSLGHHRLSIAHQHPHTHTRRAVGIVSDDPPPTVGAPDAHIFINDTDGGVDGVGVVEDGIVSLEANDDFAMGAPPGAPGAIAINVGVLGVGGVGGGESEGEGIGERGEVEEAGERETRRGPDETPRPGVVGLPTMSGGRLPASQTRDRPTNPQRTPQPASVVPAQVGSIQTQTQDQAPDAQPEAQALYLQPPLPQANGHNHHRAHRSATHHSSHHHHHGHGNSHEPQGPYRDEDVLLSLQLLAYLSKYPHVRQAFYKPRVTFHPASVDVVGGRWGNRGREKEREVAEVVQPGGHKGGRAGKDKEKEKDREGGAAGFLRSLGVGSRGKEREVSAKDKEKDLSSLTSSAPGSSSTKTPLRQTNVFSLVERFTFKPSSTEADLLSPPPRLPPEIQYWAGVVMRNACRKDDSRGGIRQCANMLCGRWEAYPREFAKCRRCRKAKYCGKECQSTAWSEGHRFWCSSKDDDDAAAAPPTAVGAGVSAGEHTEGRRERRERERERERERVRERIADIQVLRGPGVGGAVGGTPRDTRANAAAQAAQREPWPDPRHGIPRINTRNHQQFVLPPPPLPPSTQQQQQTQNPIGTPASGSPGSAMREPGITSRGPPPSTSGYLVYDIYGDTAGLGGGRRRAETVTGVTTTMGGVGPSVGTDGRGSHYPPGPVGQGRLQLPTRSFALNSVPSGNPSSQQSQPSGRADVQQLHQQFMSSPGRGEPGPSSRRRRVGDGTSPPAPVMTTNTTAAMRSPMEGDDMVDMVLG